MLLGGWGSGLRPPLGWALGLPAFLAPSASTATARARSSVPSCARGFVSALATRAGPCPGHPAARARATCAQGGASRAPSSSGTVTAAVLSSGARRRLPVPHGTRGAPLGYARGGSRNGRISPWAQSRTPSPAPSTAHATAAAQRARRRSASASLHWHTCKWSLCARARKDGPSRALVRADLLVPVHCRNARAHAYGGADAMGGRE